MIKLYDNLLEYQNQLINLEKENPDQTYLVDLNYKNKIFSVYKVFYVSLFYLLNKKYDDVYTIMHHTLESIKDINEFYEVHNLDSIASLQKLKKEIEDLENLCRFIISKSFVRMHKEKQEKLKDANKMIVDSEPLKKEKAKVKFNGWMYDEMVEDSSTNTLSRENFDLFKDNIKVSYEEYIEGLEKMNYNNYSHIVQLPPNTLLLNPKPIVYDLTFQKIQYPDLENKMKKQDKGIFGRALGYFFKK